MFIWVPLADWLSVFPTFLLCFCLSIWRLPFFHTFTFFPCHSVSLSLYLSLFPFIFIFLYFLRMSFFPQFCHSIIFLSYHSVFLSFLLSFSFPSVFIFLYYHCMFFFPQLFFLIFRYSVPSLSVLSSSSPVSVNTVAFWASAPTPPRTTKGSWEEVTSHVRVSDISEAPDSVHSWFKQGRTRWLTDTRTRLQSGPIGRL